MTKSIAVSKYEKTLDKIGVIYSRARKELVKAYWEIGREIVEVEQDGNVRAKYGTKLLENLSNDLTLKYGEGFSDTNIKHMRQFYLFYPKRQSAGELSWTHYVDLISVEDDKLRKQLEREATQKNLTTDELREKIKQTVGAQYLEPLSKRVQNIEPLRRPSNLELNTFCIADTGRHTGLPQRNKKIIDCGFYIYKPTSSARIKIVDQPSFTYKAIVERVVDGDTLWVIIDVGFNIILREKIRLRAIDTPELKTKKGEEAKQYVSKLLEPGQEIIIKTSKSEDKYGRFVADVFYSTTPMRARDLIEKGIYLNGQLLNENIAKRMT